MSVTLQNIIALVEANNVNTAWRYEPTQYGNYRWSGVNALCAAKNHCSRDTAEVILCSSWGLYQIMGYNLYRTLGYDSSINAYLNDVSDQSSIFDKFVGINGINYSVDELFGDNADPDKLEHFATLYNGPGNVTNYINSMKNAYQILDK